MIHTVFFDIDNTLYSYDQANKVAFALLCDYAEAHLGMSKETFRHIHDEMKDEQFQQMGTQAVCHNRLVRYQNILEQRHLPLYPHVMHMSNVYNETLINAAVPTEGAEELLKELKKRGIRIGIGTDMTAEIQFQKLDKLGFLPYVDFLVSSEEAMAEKPSPEFFKACLSKAECKAEECVFIGDSKKKDCIGANQAGMHGIWFRPASKADGSDVPAVEKMSQVISLIERF